MRSFAGILFFALLPFTSLLSQSNKPLISPEPVWITQNEVDYNTVSLNKEAEDGSIDLDYENQVNLADQSLYIKRSTKILSEAGVQDNSQIEISFDPTYQQLIFHTIKLIRNNVSIDKLDLKKIKIIHQEKDLDMFIYNGSLQAILLLEDVRKGDVIEFSYTLKGFNPIFKNKFQKVFASATSSPLYNIYYKIIVPPNRKINIKNYLDTINPVLHNEAGSMIYEWQKKNIHALHPQDDLPDWYDPYPSISISEFNSWFEVNEWAKMLFPFNIKLSAALKNKIDDINNSNATNDKKVSAALRFVQDDIRYMGVEMGIHSHKPAAAEKVFNQRFGDCKEKSYLLCVMLRAMGINANPVLINTDYKKAITTWLPSATSFNHCTVQVNIDNKKCWFDPTINYQRGNIFNINFPDYQYGLVITDTTTALSFIQPKDNNSENIKEVFSVPENFGVCHFKVITTYKGSYADDARSDFNSNSNYEMQKSYLQFYQDYFDNIKADSLDYTDDDSTGIFTTTEYYSIDSFWTFKKGIKSADFTCYVINSLLKKTKETNRTMPVSLRFPVHLTEEVEVNLPGSDWDLKPVEVNEKSAGFSFVERSTVLSNNIILDYDFKTLKDFVSPEESREYFSALQKINKQMDYEITWGNEIEMSNSSTGNIIGSILIVLIGVGIAVWRTQKR